VRQVWTDLDETISRPFLVPEGVTLRGGEIRLADDFYSHNLPGDPTPGLAAVVCRSHTVCDSVRLVGRPISWWKVQDRNPHFVGMYPTAGFLTRDVEDVTWNRLIVDGVFVGPGLFAQDWTGLQVLDCRVTRCNAGLGLDWPRIRGNRALTVQRLTVIDTDGLPQANTIDDSILRPGERVGANFVWGFPGIQALFEDVLCIGEGKGFKCGGGMGVTYRRIRTPNFWIGGWVADNPLVALGYKGPATASNIRVQDCILGESTFGYGRTFSSDSNMFIIDEPFADELEITGTTMLAPRPGKLYAPWWDRPETPEPDPAPGFTRFNTVNVQRGASAHFGEGCRFIDMHGDYPEPVWIAVDAESRCREEPTIPRDRYTPAWGPW
jgi:hypothetical protein